MVPIHCRIACARRNWDLGKLLVQNYERDNSLYFHVDGELPWQAGFVEC